MKNDSGNKSRRRKVALANREKHVAAYTGIPEKKEKLEKAEAEVANLKRKISGHH